MKEFFKKFFKIVWKIFKPILIIVGIFGIYYLIATGRKVF